MADTPSILVSVIIPVFNDSQPLKRCLAALNQQTYPHHLYEVIVVDNGSDRAEKIADVVAQVQGDQVRTIVACEETPGSYAARNKGIALAKGEVIAFTDADCLPASDWIEQGVKHLLQTPNCGLIAGRIDLLLQTPDRATPVEQYERVTAFRQADYLQQYRGGATANLFTFKSVIDRVGMFNATLKSGGDLEWGQRVYALGYQQKYAPEVWIEHPARSSFQQLYKKTKRVAGGTYDLYLKPEYSLPQRIKTLLRLFFDDLMFALRAILNTFKYPDLQLYQRLSVSLVAAWVAYIKISEKARLQLGGASSRS